MAETAAQKKARLAAAAREAAYINSFSNPITSQYDPRIAENAIVKPENYGVFPINGPTWQQEADLAAAGVIGPTGSTGPTGPTGSTGPLVVAKLLSTYVDPDTGDIIDVYDDGSEKIRKKGTLALNKERDRLDALEQKRLAGKSAYDILYAEFDKYGLGSLVTPLKVFIQDGLSEAELTLKLRGTPQYEVRFAANKKRIANGFAAIDEATYLGLEDRYQSIMQNYGMPTQYYARADKLGVQQYFEDAIANNVDSVTFEERIMEGKKVLDANKDLLAATKKFFPTLNDGDFLAYVLDTKNALSDIKRKVTAAEIGGVQIGAGLEATAAGADTLAAAGITGQKYQQNVSDIAQTAVRGSQLASMYGENPYTQQTAEQSILNVPGSVEAKKQTEKIKKLEEASFSKRTGAAQGALNRERAGTL